ncbi:MAG: PDGLE domain-containing protein [Chloroflexota bacterium]
MTESSPAPVAPGARDTASKGALARLWWVAGLAVAGVITVLAALFASRDPDGLDSVAIDKGFEDAAQDPGFQILPGYSIPGLDGTTSTIVSGVVGIVVIFLLVLLLGRLLARRRKDTAA